MVGLDEAQWNARVQAFQATFEPSAAEREQVHAVAKRLEAETQATIDALRLPYRATIQGSYAKDTWLPGMKDFDVFLIRASPGSEEELDQEIDAIASAVLEDARAMYAQHPYRIGTYQGFEVDLVPCLDMEVIGELATAVDRTPLHTKFMNEHLSESQRRDVRILKRLAREAQIYGAETWTGGWSGYLLEWSVHHYGSAHQVLRAWCDGIPARHVPSNFEGVGGGEVYHCQDPTDPQRNVAAGVREETIQEAANLACAVLEDPQPGHFQAPTGPLDAQPFPSTAVVTFQIRSDRPDLVHAQFLRYAADLARRLEEFGFENLEVHRQLLAPDQVAFAYRSTTTELDPEWIKWGPNLDQAPNVAQFRKRWLVKEDFIEFIEEEGRLGARAKRFALDLVGNIEYLHTWIPKPKHVQKARIQVVEDDVHPRIHRFLRGRPYWASTATPTEARS